MIVNTLVGAVWCTGIAREKKGALFHPNFLPQFLSAHKVFFKKNSNNDFPDRVRFHTRVLLSIGFPTTISWSLATFHVPCIYVPRRRVKDIMPPSKFLALLRYF